MLRIKQNSAASNASSNLVPLKQVKIDAKLHSFAANVTITQVFQNSESVPIEAVYCFPVEENAAIYAFVARIDDEREIVAEIKEKQTAQQEYSQALAEGHGAYLLEQDEASSDIFTISVGALKPNSQCLITISYVTELDLLHCNKTPTIRFVVPTTIAPRYSPTEKGIASPGGTNVQYVQSVPYTIDFTCQVDKLDQQVTTISSPSHPIKIDCTNEELFTVTLTQEGIQLDRDIIVDVELSNIRKNTIAAIDSGAAMISFTPNEQDCQQDAECGTNEFIFVIDCSGSMADENKIGLARKAMLLFLKSLPINCRFNVIRFGSSFNALFSNHVTVEYNDKNMREAEALIKGMTANMGGTELLQPLNWLKNMKRSSHSNRQIFLLTDGEVSNVDEVIQVCREMAEYTRIFSFGLGHSPSRALVKGLARATNGYFNFIAPNTSVDIYVAEQLTRALQPSVSNVEIKCNTSQTILHKVPEESPPVFFGDRLLFYALLDEEMPFDHETRVELFSNGRKEPIGVAYIDHVPSIVSSKLIMRLAAKALIRERLKDEKTVDKKVIVDLSMKYGILCPYTAFIGIERRLNANSESNMDMELREVPIMVNKAYYEGDMSYLQCGALSLSTSSCLQQAVCDVNSIMKMNIDKCLSRGQMLDDLEARAESFTFQAGSYTRCAKKSSFALPGLGAVHSVLQPVMNFFTSRKTKTRTPKTNNSFYSTPAAFNSSVNMNVTSPDANTFATEVSQMAWPTDEQKLVDRFIDLQQYDGLWILTEDDIKQLTGKQLTDFTSSTIEKLDTKAQQSIITTTIVIVILETRCLRLKTLWQALSSKASKCLQGLLGGDQSRFDELMKDIRDQLS